MSFLKDKIEYKIEKAEFESQILLGRFPKWARWFLAFSVLAILPGYYSAKNLSFKYWQRQYQPLLVSAKASFENPKIPGPLAFDITTFGQNYYSAVATVLNQNLGLSAENVGYGFEFFGQNGEKIDILDAETKGAAFFLPNQTKYLVIPKFSSPIKIAGGRITFDQKIAWRNKFSLPQIKIASYAPVITNQLDPLQFVVEGAFKNESSYHIKQVRLIFLVYSADKKVIAVSQRDEFDVAPNERRAYKQVWPRVFSLEAQKAVVVAEVNVLDGKNLQAEKTPSTPASDLTRPQKNNNGF